MSATSTSQSWCCKVLQFAASMLRGWAVRLLRVDRNRWQCGSFLGSQWVVLPDEFVEGASDVSVYFRTPWRLSWRWLQPKLTAIVLDETRQPLAPAASGSQSWINGFIECSLTFTAAQLGSSKRFGVELRHSKDQRLLAVLPFDRLDRSTLLDQLELAHFETQAKVGDEWVSVAQLHDQLEACGCRVRLKLARPEYRSALNALAPKIMLQVHREDVALNSWRTRVNCGTNTFDWRVDLSHGDGGRQGGKYRLTLSLEDRALGQVKYSVSARPTLLAEVTAQAIKTAQPHGISFSAVNHRSCTIPLEVVAEDFQKLQCELELQVSFSNPLFDRLNLPLTVALLADGHPPAIHAQEFPQEFKQGLHRLTCPLPFQASWFEVPRDSYVMEVRLRDRLLARMPFVFKSREQLIRDRQAAILTSLAVSDLRLETERDGERVITDDVFETDSRLKPKFIVQAEGFDEDVSSITWPLTVRLRNRATDNSVERTFQLRSRPGANRFSRVAIPNPAQPGRYTLVLLTGDQVLAEHGFRILSPSQALAHTQQEVAKNLQVSDAQLLIECGGQEYENQNVPFASERIKVRLNIESKGFNSLFPEWRLPAEMFLSSSRIKPVRVAQASVTLSRDPATLELPLAIANTFLAEEPDTYQLTVHLNNREIAGCAFRLISAAELVQQLEIRPFEVILETQEGGTISNPKEVEATKDGTLRIRFGTRPGLLAPGLSIPAYVEVCQDKTALFSSECEIPFGCALAEQFVRPLRVPAVWNKLGRRNATIGVRVRIGRVVKCRHAIQFVSRVRWTNFEGALTRDPTALGNVDAEYAAILRSLG